MMANDPDLSQALEMTQAQANASNNGSPAANDPDLNQALALTQASMANANTQSAPQGGPQYPTNGPINQAINQVAPALQNIPLIGNTAADMLRGYQATGVPLPMSFTQGVGQGVQGALSGAVSLYNKLPSSLQGVAGLPSTQGNLPNVPNPQALQNPISPATAFVGNMASSMALPGDLGAVTKAASLLPKAPGVLNALAPIADRALTGAGYGMLYGSANGNTPTAGSILASAAIPAGLPALAKVPAQLGTLGLKGLGYLASKDTNDLLTPAEVATRSNQIGNAPVPFGSVVNSPTLNWLYNKMGTVIPFSGINTQMRSTLGAFDNQGQNVTKQLLGNTDPENAASTLASEIKSTYNTNKTSVKQDYNAATQEADNPTTPMAPPFNLHSAPTLDSFIAKTNAQNAVPDQVSNVLSQLQDRSIFNPDVDGNITLQKAQNVKATLGKTAARLRLNPETQFEASTLSQAHDALDSDIQNQLQTNPTALGLYQKANQNFIKNIVPYRDPSIFKVANGTVDNPQNLSSVLANNQNSKIRQVVNQLSPEGKNLTLYDLFDNASKKDENGNQVTNAARLSNAYSSLSPNATNLLASPNIQNEFNKLATLKNVTQAAQLKVNAPYTGGRGPEFLKSAGGLAAGGYIAMHNPALLTGVPGLIAANRIGARFLESPQLRQAYVNQYLPRITNPNSLAGRSVNALVRAPRPAIIANALAQGNQSQ